MRILLTIAWRNLKEHRVKTLIIGLIMVVGIIVLVVGNSLMDSATAGIERSYIKNYTGHLMITGAHKGRLTLFGFQDMTAMERAVPHIADYAKVSDFVRSLPYVETINPQASASAIISIDDEMVGVTQLFGIKPEQYQGMFPDNMEVMAGEFLQPGEEGILLSELLADNIAKTSGVSLEPGDKLLLTGVSMQGGMRIREVPIKGIFRFLQSNPQLDMVSLLDIDNTRALAGLVEGHTDPAELTEKEQAFLGEVDIDSLFGSIDSVFSEVIVEEPMVEGNDDWLFPAAEVSEIVEDADSSAPNDAGSWHFLLVKLRDEEYLQQARADIENFLAENDIPAQTSDWLQAAGATAELSYGIKSIFNGIVFVIAIVAVIIVMNTLVISVTERMGEIGTMRAIGAQKSFVRKMVMWETLLLAGISGLIGIALSAVILLILNAVGIEASNMFFEIIFGGPVLRPQLSLSSVVMSLIVVAVVGVISSLYPASIVMKTSPLKAMQSE